jgi:hypothetical protein
MSAVLREGRAIDNPVYLEVAGERWRVHDTRFVSGRHVRTPLPSSHATHRIFVNEKGVRRAYAFTRGENRQLSATALEAQLRRAGYLASKPGQSHDHGHIGGPSPGGKG